MFGSAPCFKSKFRISPSHSPLMEGRCPLPIPDVDLCSTLKEKLGNAKRTRRSRSFMERSTLLGLSVYISPRLEKHLRNTQSTSGGSLVERGPFIVHPGPHVCAIVDEQLDYLSILLFLGLVSCSACKVQGRSPPGILRVGVCAIV
jgi:hypothetical protein